MVSIPDDAVWKLCTKQSDVNRWTLVLQVDDEVVDDILDSEEDIDIDQEEEKALADVLGMFSGVILACSYTMSRETGNVVDLGSAIRREIAEWMDDK